MNDGRIISNFTYGVWPLHADPVKQESIGFGPNKKIIDSGVRYLDNGDIEFRVYAPGVSTVSISSGWKKLELKKDSEGYFNAVLPYDPEFVGPHSMDFIIDGSVFIYPYAPISWHKYRPVNYLDLPDPETEYILTHDVPHGTLSREIFFSAATGRYERCLVYTPHGYMKGTDSYPVLYLQHGATENETVWEYNGRMSAIMDNLIADGKCVPMIVVMNNGEVRYPGSNVMDDCFENMLIGDCVPYIEENYRVIPDKWHRAMAGLSMGSMQTSKIGLTHPELFSALGIFSGFMRYGAGHATQKDDHLAIIFDNERFLSEYKLFFRSVGEADDNMMDAFVVDEGYVERSGIDKLPNYQVRKYPGQRHEFGAWRRALHDFAQLLFRW